MYSQSDNIEIHDKADEVIEKLFDIKLCWKYQWLVVILSLIVLICCITNLKRSESYIARFYRLDKKQKDDSKSYQCGKYVHTWCKDS